MVRSSRFSSAAEFVANLGLYETLSQKQKPCVRCVHGEGAGLNLGCSYEENSNRGTRRQPQADGLEQCAHQPGTQGSPGGFGVGPCRLS